MTPDREAKIAAAVAALGGAEKARAQIDSLRVCSTLPKSGTEPPYSVDGGVRAFCDLALAALEPPAPDGKALRELRVWVEGQRDAASSDYKAAGSADERAACNIEIHAYQRVMGQIDRLPSAAPAADAEVEASREATMLRAAIAKIAAAVGAGVDPQCTVEFLCEVPKEVESVVGKLRAENARLQTDLAAARADQAAMAREQLTAVLGEVVANYETRWDRDIEIRWCPQRWLRTYITTRLAALPQPKPAAEPVPELSVPELSATVNSEIAALTADRDKWKKAASELCPKHIGGHYTTCPVCHGVRMKAERDEAVLAMKRHKLTAALPPLPIDEGREPLATMRLLPAVPGEEIFGVPIEGRPFPNDDLPNRVEPKP